MNKNVSIRANSQRVSSTILDTIKATSRQEITRKAIIGAGLGLTWGAALRAWMVILALKFGEQPKITWAGTFGGILLPAALMGAVLGGSMLVVKTGGQKRWRWSILSPLLMVLGSVVATKNFFTILFTTGMGSGAIGVALIGILGGYAFSGHGPLWRRRASGLTALLLTFASGIGFFFAPSPTGTGGAKNSPGGGEAFGAIYFILLMAALIAGVSAPFRSRSKLPGKNAGSASAHVPAGARGWTSSSNRLDGEKRTELGQK